VPPQAQLIGGRGLALNLIGLGAQSAASWRAADSQAGAPAGVCGVARILVIDNEEHVRTILGTILRREGYEIHYSANGHTAFQTLQQNTIDVVLTEIEIRDGNGIGLIERVAAEFPGLPVVVVTTVNDIGVAVDSMRRGAYDYVPKPFERDHLIGVVQRALEHSRLQRINLNYQKNLESVVRARTEMLCQAIEELEHSYDITLEALGDALDLKDSETEGHSKRVTAYTIALARAIGIGPAEIKVIARGAFLHDIGKMAIPDEILRKPGKLTGAEQELMREHCLRGYNILCKIPFLSEAAEIVLSHHEHFGGGGYPRGLHGAEIPIGARIFAISDTLDAITSDRPYRQARGFEVAREEILRFSGTQFDPGVIEAFLRMPNELWQELRSEITGQNRQFSTFNLASLRPIEG
jgi:putative nucleotidyltransferase with HDIG domain